MKNKKLIPQTIFNTLTTAAKTAVLVILVFASGFTPALASPLSGQESAIISRTNAIRAEAGLPALSVDSRLMQSAAAKAADMATRNYFDHVNPDGYRMAYWINNAGYSYSLAGENLAKGFSSIDRLINAWVASATHYKNLVESKFTNIGVGMAEGMYNGQETLFIVQHFGATPTTLTKQADPLTSLATPLIAPLVESVAGQSDTRTATPSIVYPSPWTGNANITTVPEFQPSVTADSPIEEPAAPVSHTPAQSQTNWLLVALVSLITLGCLADFIWLLLLPRPLIQFPAK